MVGVNFTFTCILIPTISLNGNLTIYLLPKFIIASFNYMALLSLLFDYIALLFLLLIIVWSFNSIFLPAFSSAFCTSLSSILLLSSSSSTSKLFILFSKFLTLLVNNLSSSSNSTSCLHLWFPAFKHKAHACFKYILQVNIFSWLG